MNWGNKLVLAFILFAALMFTLVYKAVNTKFDLVSKDYYKDELRYQDKIDGVSNANKLSNVLITQNDSQITLELPTEMKGMHCDGEIWLYCSNDAGKDRKITLQIDSSGKQIIQKNTLAKGKYQCKLNWKSTGNLYYHEQNLTVN